MMTGRSSDRIHLSFLVCVFFALVVQAASADTVGRAYLLTTSNSANVTFLHVINSSDTSQAFTGTLYAGDGSQLGDANVPLHNGSINSQGRFVLTAQELETLFNVSPWSGPAILEVRASSEFDLMSKLTSPSGLVSNTNCVREGTVHNVEGFDATSVRTFIRFINTTSEDLSDIRGTLFDQNGQIIGTENVQLLSSLAAKSATWLNRDQISALIGAEWNGSASLTTSNNSGLKLLNLNFINNETFFNFSCFETSDSSGVFLMTTSNSQNISETHLINTSDQSLSFSGTVYASDGTVVGNASSALHSETIAPNGRVVISAPDIETAVNGQPWQGPALIEISASDTFESMIKLTSPSGLISNTNCVRQNNVHNIEGFESSSRTFVRLINTGTTEITDIRGTMYDQSGAVIGNADSLLLSSLAAKGATWLQRDTLSELVQSSWNSEASLVITDPDPNLQLLNLNFVNDETFFNFSCYERSETEQSAFDLFSSTVSEPIIQSKCIACHVDGGIASGTGLVFERSSETSLQNNFSVFETFAESREDARDYILLKASGGGSHTGGVQLPEGGTDYNNMAAFLDALTNSGSQTPVSQSPAFFEGVSLQTNLATLRRAAIIVAGRIPTSAEESAVANGNDATLRSTLRDMMTGEGFHEFLTDGANDRLLVRGTPDGAFLDGGGVWPNWANTLVEHLLTQNTLGLDAYFPLDRHYETVDRGLRESPLELIAYVVENDRPYSEILTADYMMLNPQANDALGATGSYSDDEDASEFQPARIEQHYLYGDSTIDEFVSEVQSYRILDPGSNFINYPHAGVINTQSFLFRYPTTATNRNRARARWTYLHFLDTDIEMSAQRTTDPDALADTNNPTLLNPNCTVCHATMDPVAGAFQNYSDEGFYRVNFNGLDSLDSAYKFADDTPYIEGDTWYKDMRTPGFNGMDAPDNNNSVQWLAEEIVSDTRFARAAVKFWWPAIIGTETLTAPEDISDVNYDSHLLAFDAQSATIDELANALIAADMNLKDMLVEMIMTSWFRAASVNADGLDETVTDAQARAGLGNETLLTPARLARKTRVLTGYGWNAYRQHQRDKDIYGLSREFALYYGGIDSQGVTKRSREITPLMSTVAMKHALESACPIVLKEFMLPDAERRLFGGIDETTTPANGETAIRAKLIDLHSILLGKNYTSSSDEINTAYDLLSETWQARTDEFPLNLGNNPDESCNWYRDEFYFDDYANVEEYRDTITDVNGYPGYLFNDTAQTQIDNNSADPEHMKSVWTTVMTYLLTHYHYLYE